MEAEASKGIDFREKVTWSKILKPSQVQHVRVLQGGRCRPRQSALRSRVRRKTESQRELGRRVRLEKAMGSHRVF